MVYLNFTDLSEEAQQRLLTISRSEIEKYYGDSIRQYAREHHIDVEKILEQETLRNLYSYTYVFNIWIVYLILKSLWFFLKAFLLSFLYVYL